MVIVDGDSREACYSIDLAYGFCGEHYCRETRDGKGEVGFLLYEPTR
jgi:hypothetical protein